MDEGPGKDAGDGGEGGEAGPAFQGGDEDAGEAAVFREGQREDEAGEDEEDGDRGAAVEESQDELDDDVERAVPVRDGAHTFGGVAEDQVVEDDDGGGDAA